MQIFMFDRNNHRKNAKLLDDLLLNKMIVETQQLLSTYFGGGSDLYKPCFQKHPCNLWLKESTGNVFWLFLQLKGYLHEWNLRFRTVHKNILLPLSKRIKNILEHGTEPMTEWKGLFGESGCNNYTDYYNWKKTQYKKVHKFTNAK